LSGLKQVQRYDFFLLPTTAFQEKVINKTRRDAINRVSTIHIAILIKF